MEMGGCGAPRSDGPGWFSDWSLGYLVPSLWGACSTGAQRKPFSASSAMM